MQAKRSCFSFTGTFSIWGSSSIPRGIFKRSARRILSTSALSGRNYLFFPPNVFNFNLRRATTTRRKGKRNPQTCFGGLVLSASKKKLFLVHRNIFHLGIQFNTKRYFQKVCQANFVSFSSFRSKLLVLSAKIND